MYLFYTNLILPIKNVHINSSEMNVYLIRFLWNELCVSLAIYKFCDIRVTHNMLKSTVFIIMIWNEKLFRIHRNDRKQEFDQVVLYWF